MISDFNLFIRQKGRQRGNNFMPLNLTGSGNRAERRQAARERKKQIKRNLKQTAGPEP